MIKTLSIFILFLLFLFETRALGVHYRIDIKQCKVVSKTFDSCIGKGRMCSDITMNCQDSFPWYSIRKVSSTMYADEVTWVVAGAVIDCTMYVLSNGATKISNGTLIYLDGEPVSLGDGYSIRSFLIDPMYLISFLLGLSITGIIFNLKVGGKPPTAGDKSPAPPNSTDGGVGGKPPTSPKTYAGSGLNERGKHKRPDTVPALGFDGENI